MEEENVCSEQPRQVCKSTKDERDYGQDEQKY